MPYGQSLRRTVDSCSGFDKRMDIMLTVRSKSGQLGGKDESLYIFFALHYSVLSNAVKPRFHFWLARLGSASPRGRSLQPTWLDQRTNKKNTTVVGKLHMLTTIHGALKAAWLL